MSVLLSILFFVVVFPLLGWSFLRILKLRLANESFFEQSFIFWGIGLALFPLLVILLNFFRIPLLWWIFVIFALIIPFINLIKTKFNIPLNYIGLLRNPQFLIVLVIFVGILLIMLNGTFLYPYLEDDDSWGHALSAKYVAIEKNLRLEPRVLPYLNPYPPAYAALMGILHQTNNSIYWTLKFFNALIVALTIPFFYLFANLIFKNKNKALFSTFILASLPSFLSHFIWAHSLVILYIIIALYWIFYRRENLAFDPRMSFSMLPMVISAVLFTQITQAIKLSILLIALFIISYSIRKKIDSNLIITGLVGFIAGVIFWWGSRAFDIIVKTQASAVARGKGFILANNIGTGSRAYTLSEFLFPPHQGLMTNPVGIGLIVSLLALIGVLAIVLILIFKWSNLDTTYKENSIFILFAAIFTFLGVNSVTFNLPIGLFAFRFWMLLAIPVSILAAYGLWWILSFCKKLRLSKFIPFIVIFILLGVIITSAYPKYSINTSFWPPIYSPIFPPQIIAEELSYFAQLRETPEQRFFPLCKDGFKKLIGNDQIVCAWCKGELEFRKQIFNKTAAEIHSFLQSYDYKGVIPDLSCLEDHSEEQLNTQLNKLLNSGLFKLNNNLNRLIILEVI